MSNLKLVGLKYCANKIIATIKMYVFWLTVFYEILKKYLELSKNKIINIGINKIKIRIHVGLHLHKLYI